MPNQIVTKFNDLGIGTKLIGGFLFLALLCAAVGYWGVRSMTQINKGIEDTNENLIPSIRALTDMRANLGIIQRTERSFVLAGWTKNVARQQQAAGAQEVAWRKVRESAQQYETYPMTDKEEQLWKELRLRLDEFRRDHEATMAAAKKNDFEEAEKLCSASVPNTLKVMEAMTTLCDMQSEFCTIEAREGKERYESARTTMFAVSGGAVVAAVLLGMLFRNLTVRPLSATTEVLRSVAAGDLSQKIAVSSRDEFGQMGAALNATVDGIRTALNQDKVNWEAVGRQREQNTDFVYQLAAVSKVQAMIEFKLDGTVVAANDNFLLALGYALPEIQNRHHSMFVEPAYATSAEYREFWARLNRGEYVASEFKRVGKGGKEVWIQASYNPILDPNGKPYKVVKFATDITAAKAMEQKVKDDALELQRKVEAIVVPVDALANGDFTQQVPDLGSDVVGQMAGSLNKAILSIRTALEGVREVSEQLADASNQLSAVSSEISTGAQEQASGLEETASTMEQITATVKQSADNAQQARQLASSSKEVAEKGGAVVGSAVDAMSEINASSKKIAEIITAIDEIAFQTNLLALNAAVEAARAGEQGRGFAVVAAEVRNLAQRSATAAKEIKSLIQDSVRKVDTGTELVNRSGTTLAEIVTSVKRVTDIVTEIAAASREQSTGIEQVNKAVSQMDTVTQRNASQTEEMSATAQTLTDQAAQLRDLVARFKLSDTGAACPATRPAPKPAKKAVSPKPRAAVARAMSNGHSSGHAHELDSLGGSDGFTEF